MSFKQSFGLSFMLVLLSACQPSDTASVTRWHLGEGELKEEVRGQVEALKSESKTAQFSGYKSHIVAPQVRGIETRGFEIHGVQNPSDQWVEVTHKDEPTMTVLQTLRANRMQRALLGRENQFLKAYPNWRVQSKEVVLFEDRGGPSELAYEIVAFRPDDSDVVRFRFSYTWDLLEQESVAHQMVVGEARVFPGNPDATDISSQFLPGLLGTGRLQGERVSLISDRAESPYASDHIFRFETSEDLFDDVQAYFFADKAILWFQEKLNLSLNRILEVKVHVGSPRKTNTAFYYDYKIRFGSGDGKTYRQIPRDPTIVSHEVAHAFVQQLSGLPFKGEGGSLNEGFADYFAGEITNQSQMAEFSYIPGPFRRDINNGMRVEELTGSLYGDSLLVSGSLWDVRKALGSEKAISLATLVLMHLGPHATLKDFPEILLRLSAQTLSAQDAEKVEHIVIHRGWNQIMPLPEGDV